MKFKLCKKAQYCFVKKSIVNLLEQEVHVKIQQ